MNTSSIPDLSPLQHRKRSAILDGAKTVFLSQGFGLATMDDVAAAAGVGKQTVYRHFKSKEALAAEALDVAFAASLKGLDEALDTNPKNTAQKIGRAHV